MKKIYMIYGWGGSSKGEWFNFLNKEFSKKNFEVKAFDMPDTDIPTIEKWVKYLEKNIPLDALDEHTYFLGHSIGCQTIMRYLDKLPKTKNIGGCIFIAGWFNLREDSFEEDKEKEIAEPWITNKINFNRIKRHTNNFLSFFSDNDPFVPLSDMNLFKDKLNSKIILKKNKGHFDTLEDFQSIKEEVFHFLK